MNKRYLYLTAAYVLLVIVAPVIVIATAFDGIFIRSWAVWRDLQKHAHLIADKAWPNAAP
jgi:hypothetical protein